MSTISIHEYDPAERQAFRAFGEVIRITNELFGDVQVKETCDPEFADEKYVVLIVRVKGSTKQLLALEEEWVEKVSKVAKNWESFRLSIRPIA